MQQRSSKLLYDYWNIMRRGRLAPARFEIEPSKIASLLPETFILECSDPGIYRVRLAGTRICTQLGYELRDTDMLDCWPQNDREALDSLLHNVKESGAVVSVRLSVGDTEGRKAWFEMTLMPLIHSNHKVNRMLGCFTAIDPPFWLGTTVLKNRKLLDFELTWPNGTPAFVQEPAVTSLPAVETQTPVQRHTETDSQDKPRLAGDARRKFRVYEGGLSSNS